MAAAARIHNYLDILDPMSDASGYVLLILNQPISVNVDEIVSLWKKATLRILVDGGSNRWLDFNQKNNLQDLPLPEYITGDFDSITPKTRAYFEERRVKFIHTPDQDETDFTKALRVSQSVTVEKKLNVKCVVALCETSGRLDQIMANLETLYHAENVLNVPLLEVSSDSVTWLLQQGNNSIQVKQEFVDKQYWCGLIPLCGPTIVTTSGLKWNLDNGTLAFGQLVSTSNTYANRSVEVATDESIAWTMQYMPEKF